MNIQTLAKQTRAARLELVRECAATTAVHAFLSPAFDYIMGAAREQVCSTAEEHLVWLDVFLEHWTKEFERRQKRGLPLVVQQTLSRQLKQGRGSRRALAAELAALRLPKYLRDAVLEHYDSGVQNA
jgi:hypothetical protein